MYFMLTPLLWQDGSPVRKLHLDLSLLQIEISLCMTNRITGLPSNCHMKIIDLQGRGLTEAFHIPESKLASFLQHIEAGYVDHPYHNRFAWGSQPCAAPLSHLQTSKHAERGTTIIPAAHRPVMRLLATDWADLHDLCQTSCKKLRYFAQDNHIGYLPPS